MMLTQTKLVLEIHPLDSSASLADFIMTFCVTYNRGLRHETSLMNRKAYLQSFIPIHAA